MRLRRSAPSFLLLTGLCLGVLSPARAAEDATPDPAATVGQVVSGPEGLTDGALAVRATSDEAQRSLDEVEDLFGPMSRTEARSLIASGDGKDATMALRDLSLRMGSLSKSQQGAVDFDVYRRPWGDTQYEVACKDNICVHWIPAETYDGDDVATQEYATTVLDTLVHVSSTYQTAGYRLPRGDGTRGGSTDKTDIYLADVGSQGKYGYCTIDASRGSDGKLHPDFPPPNPQRRSDLPAFCVLDNDFKASQFPTGRSALQDLEVTAAHEYFHAVQFAYDYFEDRWFMEATATWAEDQVYDSINDNVQYLRGSQLRHPGVSLDTFYGAGGVLQYGDWIYFSYLTQRLPARTGELPTLVRRMWQYADSVAGPDLYSVQAINAALREKGADFDRTFAQYAAANRHPLSAYSDGGTQRLYPVGRPRRTVRLEPGKRTASAAYRIDHLASATTRFVPRRLPARRHRLSLSVNMANTRSGSVAVALVYARSGRITTKIVHLGRNGNGKVRVPFSSRTVSRVELLLVNANHAFRRCWVNSAYSCSGVPAKDDVRETLSAKVS